MSLLVLDAPPSFLGGVSQQDSVHRIPNQCAEQINCWAAPVDDLRPRHPTDHQTRFFGSENGSAHGGPMAYHAIDRGAGNRYTQAFGHQVLWGQDQETGETLPILSAQRGTIVLNSVPTDNSQVTINCSKTNVANNKNFIFDSTAVPADADPNYYINTVTYNTADLASKRLAQLIRDFQKNARGALTFTGQPTDGGQFVLNDGVNPAVTFEFDTNASVVETNTLRRIVVGSTTALTVTATIYVINNAPLLNITASQGSGTTINLANDNNGIAGNVAITETATNFTATGMTGGSADSQEAWYSSGVVTTCGDAPINSSSPPNYGVDPYLTKSGGDSATSITLDWAQLRNFLPLKALAPQLLTLITPEDLSDNQGSVREDPLAGGPVATPWKAFGTATTTTIQYNAGAGAAGPWGGGYKFSQLRAVGNVGGEEAYWYYRFVKSGEPTYLNTFAPASTLQVVSAYVKINGLSAPVGTLGFGFLNATASLWKRVDFTVSGLTITTATGINGATGSFEDVGFGWYRIWCAYKTSPTEATDQRRLGFYMTVGAAVDKRIEAYGVRLEHTNGISTPTNFLVPPNEAYRMRTLGDTTVVVNTTKIAAIDQSKTKGVASPVAEAYLTLLGWNYEMPIWCKVDAGNYSFKAAAVANGNVGNTQTAPIICVNGTDISTKGACADSNGGLGVLIGNVAIPALGCKTSGPSVDTMMEDLRASIATAIAATADIKDDGYTISGTNGAGTSMATVLGFTCERMGAVIRLTANAPFKLEVIDGNGNTTLVKAHGTVERPEWLPPNASDGFVVRVAGDTDSELDDYFATPTVENPGSFSKVSDWNESAAPGTHLRYDASTMPHRLVLKTDTAGLKTGTVGKRYWELLHIAWDEKLAGDDTLNPDPAFIGHVIRDVEFVFGRFHLLSEQRDMASSTGGLYFNHWRTAVRRVDDDDPFEADAAHGSIPILKDAISLGGRMFLRSDLSIFTLEPFGSVPTPRTAYISAMEEIQSLAHVHATSAEHSIFFVGKHGDFGTVYESSFVEYGSRFATTLVSQQIPTYIVGSPIQIVASQQEGVLALLTDTSNRYIYIHRFDRVGDQQIQRAWWKYDFGVDAKVRGIQFVGSYLMLLIMRGYELCVERMRIGQSIKDVGQNWLCHMDRRVTTETAGYSSIFGGVNTVITLPWRLDPNATVLVCKRGNGDPFTVASTGVTGGGLSTVTIAGNITAFDLWVGQQFDASYELSRHQLRDDSGGVIAGTNLITRGHVAYNATAKFRIETTIRNQSARTITFAANDPASQEITALTATQPAIDRGVKEFAVGGKANQAKIVIRNSTYFPFALSKISFEDDHTPRGKKI